MKRGLRPCLAILALVVASARIPAAQATLISFEVDNIAGNTWEYSYTVENDSLGIDIEEFTIFFDVGLYENLALASAPTGWDPLAVDPLPVLLFDGFYDALALGPGLAPGGSLGGFSVLFDFLGSGTPDSQQFEIIDPNTFQALEFGTTSVALSIPEPGSAPLFAIGLVLLTLVASYRRKRIISFSGR